MKFRRLGLWLPFHEFQLDRLMLCNGFAKRLTFLGALACAFLATRDGGRQFPRHAPKMLIGPSSRTTTAYRSLAFGATIKWRLRRSGIVIAKKQARKLSIALIGQFLAFYSPGFAIAS